MKKLIVLAVVLLAAGGMLAADNESWSERFTQDARVMGMGGAFTAVADDVYALFYNPAGLAYIDRSDLLLGFTVYSKLDNKLLDDFLDEKDVDLFEFIDDFTLMPRAGFASRNWGVAAISNIQLKEAKEVGDTLDLEMVNNLGLMGGFGLNFGPFAVGGNLRLYKSIPVSESIDPDSFAPMDFASSLFDFEKIGEAEDNFKIGAGAMFSLGVLTAGIYVDDFITIVSEDTDGAGDIFSRTLKTASVGAAFTPFKNRLNPQQFSLLNLIIAADVNNIGDEDNRSVNIGSELGIHLGKALTVDVRGGYQQPMGKDFSFDPDMGEVFFGAGAKLLALDLNVGFAVPAPYMMDVLEDKQQDFADYTGKPRVTLSGGIRL